MKSRWREVMVKMIGNFSSATEKRTQTVRSCKWIWSNGKLGNKRSWIWSNGKLRKKRSRASRRTSCSLLVESSLFLTIPKYCNFSTWEDTWMTRVTLLRGERKRHHILRTGIIAELANIQERDLLSWGERADQKERRDSHSQAQERNSWPDVADFTIHFLIWSDSIRVTGLSFPSPEIFHPSLLFRYLKGWAKGWGGIWSTNLTDFLITSALQTLSSLALPVSLSYISSWKLASLTYQERRSVTGCSGQLFDYLRVPCQENRCCHSYLLLSPLFFSTCCEEHFPEPLLPQTIITVLRQRETERIATVMRRKGINRYQESNLPSGIPFTSHHGLSFLPSFPPPLVFLSLLPYLFLTTFLQHFSDILLLILMYIQQKWSFCSRRQH